MSNQSTELTFSFNDMNSDERLRELILYISDKCTTDPGYSATKLNKILYYADFESFRNFGEPITGAEYMRIKNGPAPRRMLPIRTSMEGGNELVIQKRAFYTREQHRPIPLREADLGTFGGRDIAMVDEIIKQLWGKTATEVSDESHGIAWHVARDKEAIPYEASLILDEGITQDDILRAKELVNQYGWE